MIAPAAFAALAVWLWWGPPASAALRRLEPGLGASIPRGRWWRAVGVLGVAVPVIAAGPWLAWWAAAVAAGGTLAWLVRSRARRRSAARAADEVAQGARLLASLLRTGSIPAVALAEAARDCPALEFAAGVSQLGGDVGEALRRDALTPGREHLAAIAAAWQLSERSGAPMADALTRVSESLRHRRALRALIEAELAAARTSGHIMAALPFAALGLGVLVGADPLAFLLGGAWGSLLVLCAVLLTALGVLWTERLAARAER